MPAPVLPAAHVFEPGIISGPANDGSPTIGDKGNTLLFARSTNYGVILESHRVGHTWTKPAIASFSGTWNDWSPEFSPDGSYAVYVSVRPKIGANLWRVDRLPNGWGTPVRLPDTVNIGHSIWKPSIVRDGSIYFVSIDRAGHKRLYCSRYVDGKYQVAQPVSFSDENHGDVDPEVAPDESLMIFASNGRLHGDSADHLYVAFRRAGRWSEPVPLRYHGDDVGGRSTDDEPHFGPDGRTLYFSSDRLVKVAPFPRSRAQAQAELERMDIWNNGNLNAWVVPIGPIGARPGGS